MESNLFIKNYSSNGNKITDIQFYGDMEIDVGGGPIGVEYEYVNKITPPMLPYGVTMNKEVRSGKLHVTFTNTSTTKYVVRAYQNNLGSSLYLDPESEADFTFSTTSTLSKYLYYLLSEDLNTIVGFIYDL